MESIFFNYQFKYIIIGNSNVGKTKLLLRYTKDEYISAPKATIGIDYGSKTEMINDDIYNVLIYDTAGTEIFHSLTKKVYSNATCALIVYDITNRDSFEQIKTWLNDVWSLCQDYVVVALVGNKNDMTSERVVSYEEGNYESLVVEIGEAKGENWWCVLFPPLCSIDVKKEDKDFVEYKSKVLEILNHYN